MTTTAATNRARLFPGIAWHGHWIAPEEPRRPASEVTFGGEIPPHPFSRVQFRRQFGLDQVPASAPARLTADARYVLWVNGQEVGRGPTRSQPRRLRYDEYDLAPYLRVGENSIAVLVTYYGAANAFWQPAAANGGLGTDALLVFEAVIGGEWIVSDGAWATRRSPAWTTFPHGALDGVPVEALDARALPHDWVTTGFDDTGWDRAQVVATTHIGGLARSQPPTDPFGALLPRLIGPLGGDVVRPDAVLDSSLVPIPQTWDADHPADRVLQVLRARTTADVPGALPSSAVATSGSAHHVSLDFGRIVAGFVEFEVDAPEGTTVELLYRELRWSPATATVLSAPRTGARYVARGHDDTFSALELNGLRFLHLLIHGAGDAEVTVRDVRVREHFYPRAGEAFFRSSDPEIDALYAAGIRTVSMNSFDAFTDCPTREQRAWVGDGVVHQMVTLTTSTDWRLARNYVVLGNSPRSDGILPMTVVGEIEAGGSVTIPDWSLHWVHGVYTLYLHDGDTEAVLEVLPTVERILRWYEPYVDEHGTISDVPEWNLVDWASVFSTGRNAILTALWARGLAELAAMSDYVGNAGSARWARDRWDAARAGFEDFWDEARGTYVDHLVDGVRRPAASQAAGATAIVSGLAPRARWTRIIDAITDPAAVVVRSWIGGSDGGYDPAKIAAQAAGIQHVDWDPEREVVLAEPFFSYVVHDAVAAAGQAGLLVTLIRRWSQFLVDGYDTFGECWGWGTPVHGWSSTPTRDLISHVLGVTPDLPGYRRARIAPALGDLTHASGAVPTPFGLITVDVGDGTIDLDSPVPVVLAVRGAPERELGAGRHTVPIT